MPTIIIEWENTIIGNHQNRWIVQKVAHLQLNHPKTAYSAASH